MSRNRKRTRHYVDLGDGVSFATTLRGPMDDKTRDALTELARLVTERTDLQTNSTELHKCGDAAPLPREDLAARTPSQASPMPPKETSSGAADAASESSKP